MKTIFSSRIWISLVRRFMRGMFYLGIGLAILMTGLYALLQTDAATAYLKRRIVSVLEGATGARYEIGQLSGNLISGATLRNAAIYNPESEIPLFAFETIRVTYALPLLITGRLYLPSVEVDGFSSFLAAGPDGHWNTAALLPPKRKPRSNKPHKQFKLIIGEVSVKNAEMGLAWYAGGKKRELRFTDGTCRTRLTIGSCIENEIRQLSFHMPWPGVTFEKISGGVDYDIRATRLGFDATRFRTADRSDLTVDGGVTFRGGAEFDLNAVFARLAATEIGRMFPIPVRETSVAGRLEVNGTLDALAHRIEFTRDKMSLETAGTFAFRGPDALALFTEGNVSHYNPEMFPFYPIDGIAGDISAAFSFDGKQLVSAENRRMKIDISASESELSGFAAESAQIATAISEAGIEIERFDWAAPYGKAHASGRIDRPWQAAAEKPLQINASFTDFDPAVFPVLKSAEGAINLDLELKGNLSPAFRLARSTIDLHARMLPSQLSGLENLSGEVDLSWKDLRLAVRRLSLNAENSALDAEGTVDFNDDSCQGRFNADLPDLKAVSAFLPPPHKGAIVTGAADLSGALSGTWYRPDFSARMEFKNLKSRTVSAAYAVLETEGTLVPEGVLASGILEGETVACNELAVSDLTADWRMSPDRVTLRSEIRAGEDRMELSGSVDGWRNPEREITLDRLRLSSSKLPPFVNTQPITLKVCGNHLEIEALHLKSQEALLAGRGSVELVPGGSISSRLWINQFNLERVARFFPALKQVRGTLSGDVRISDSLSSPAIDASFGLAACSCYGINLDRIDTTARYQDGGVSISANGFRDDLRVLEADGSLQGRLSLHPFAWEPETNGFTADITASGFRLAEFDLPFSEDYEADGTLDLRSHLSGDLSAPRISGNLALKDAHLNLPDYGLTYETVESEIEFIGESIHIRKLQIGGDKEGQLNAAGQIGYDGIFHPRRFDVRISGSNFHLPFRNAVFVRAEPELVLTGTPEAPELSGQITASGGKVFLDRLLKQQPAEIEVIESNRETDGTYLLPEPSGSLGFIEPLAADIVVRIDEDLWVKGKEENLEIAGQVRLNKGHGETFKLYGTLYSVRGTYLFRNRLFRITKGEIRFLGLDDIDPNVNIEAQTRVQDVTIIIRLTGSFKNLQLTLDSQPYMQTVDIISYMMFGRPVAELSQGESFRAEEAALSITGQLAADQLKAILGDSFRLDLIHISTGNGDISKGAVSLGKYIAPNLFVTYNQGFTQEVPRSVEVDYEITKHFSIEAQIDQERTSAVDLIWKHDYSGFLEFLFEDD